MRAQSYKDAIPFIQKVMERFTLEELMAEFPRYFIKDFRARFFP